MCAFCFNSLSLLLLSADETVHFLHKLPGALTKEKGKHHMCTS